MPSHRISPETHALIVRLWTHEGIRSFREIGRRTGGLHRLTIRGVLRGEGLLSAPRPAGETRPKVGETSPRLPLEVGETSPGSRPDPSPHRFTREESADAGRVEFTSDERIRTLEDAIAYAEVDTAVWRVDRWECTGWEQGLKLRDFDARGKVTGEKPLTKSLWRVKLYLKRIVPKPFADATDAIVERMKAHSPGYPGPIARRPPADPHLLEVSLFDVHIGKLAWAPETGGEDYDLKIAEQVFRNAVEDLVHKAAGFNIDKVVFPLGNDFFHVDTLTSTTTAGTFVDADGRLAKIIEVGEMAVIWAIEFMLGVAPVHVLWVPGNHDRLASYHLARTISAWFRNCPDVTVDCSPKVRKYIHYGTNLVGFTHGNEERHASLPVIMATEMPHEWAASTTREFHVGHYHSSRKTETLPVATHDGVVVRTLRSLSATDSWHAARGFIGSTRAGEGYLLSMSEGYTGHFIARARG